MSGGGDTPVRATWARLRSGAWGLRCEGTVATGDVVRAERRSGASALVRVGRVAWTGDGITLAEAGDEVREPRAEAAPRRRGGTRRAAPVEAPALVQAPEAAPEAPASAEPVLVSAWAALLARAAGTPEGDAARGAHYAVVEEVFGAAMSRSQIGPVAGEYGTRASEIMAREAGEAAARAHRALDALIAAGALLVAAQTGTPPVRGQGAPAPVEAAPAPVAEAPVQAAAEPPRAPAPGCKPWRRCLACAACAPDAIAPAGDVPF